VIQQRLEVLLQVLRDARLLCPPRTPRAHAAARTAL
jgi:hypothetical protein